MGKSWKKQLSNADLYITAHAAERKGTCLWYEEVNGETTIITCSGDTAWIVTIHTISLFIMTVFESKIETIFSSSCEINKILRYFPTRQTKLVKMPN